MFRAADFDEMDGFLGAFVDAEMVKEMVGGVAGGGAHALIDGLIAANVSFFAPNAASPTTTLAKRAGLSLALGLIGGRLVWDRNRNMAMGMLGSAGAKVAQLIAAHTGFTSDNTSLVKLGGYRMRPARRGGVAVRGLRGSRAHDQGAFAPFGLRVQEGDPAMAALAGAL